MEGKQIVRYYIYATVNGQATEKFYCKDKQEVREILDTALDETIEEELLYQSTNMEEV